DFEDVVNIFITANIEDRIKMVRERHQCDEEAAQKIINQKENARASYYNFYTGKKWGYSDNYHLCINSSLLGLEGTVEFIKHFIMCKYDGKE
ncbi:MAG: cytidylate kinase-like family protein, partial [Prevotella sp.]|nr:cytidylate kinase-like family protein [Prevotella sp.]